MLNLLLIGLFTGFFLAVLEPLTSFLEVVISAVLINSTAALLFACVGTYLVGISSVKEFILYSCAGAFLGGAALMVTEKAASRRSVVINRVAQ